MKQISIIVLIIFQSCSLLSQGETVEKKGYNILPNSLLDEITLIEIVFNQIKMDYWEYRSSQCTRINDCPQYLSDCYNYKDTCPYTIILNGGRKSYIKDSIEINNVNITNGFSKPNNLTSLFYYFFILKENKYQILNSLDSLLAFLCPINTMEKALYYSLLREYSFGAGITYTSMLKHRQHKVYYNKRENIYEFIYVSNAIESIVSKRKRAILFYPEYYLRVNENGEIYIERVGTKKLRDKKFGQRVYYAIP